MRQLRSAQSGARVVVDVDGRLDAVNGHDLQRTVDALCADGPVHVHLDLTRVTDADTDGLAALAGCSQRAVDRRHVLTWSRCSRPLLLALHEHPRIRPRARPPAHR